MSCDREAEEKELEERKASNIGLVLLIFKRKLQKKMILKN